LISVPEVPGRHVRDINRLTSSSERETFGWRPPYESHSLRREDGDCRATRLLGKAGAPRHRRSEVKMDGRKVSSPSSRL
jgi:hypothetical protein